MRRILELAHVSDTIHLYFLECKMNHRSCSLYYSITLDRGAVVVAGPDEIDGCQIRITGVANLDDELDL